VRARKIDRVDGATLKGAIRENVDRSAKIMTDEWAAYHGIGTEFDGGHEIVTHSAGEYARGDAHVNSAESYFALLKRGVIGAFITSQSSTSIAIVTSSRSGGITDRLPIRRGQRSQSVKARVGGSLIDGLKEPK
jgi:hypothetical protein